MICIKCGSTNTISVDEIECLCGYCRSPRKMKCNNCGSFKFSCPGELERFTSFVTFNLTSNFISVSSGVVITPPSYVGDEEMWLARHQWCMGYIIGNDIRPEYVTFAVDNNTPSEIIDLIEGSYKMTVYSSAGKKVSET